MADSKRPPTGPPRPDEERVWLALLGQCASGILASCEGGCDAVDAAERERYWQQDAREIAVHAARVADALVAIWRARY